MSSLITEKTLTDFPRSVTIKQLAIVLGYIMPCGEVDYYRLNCDYLTDDIRNQLRMPKKTKIIDYLRLKRLSKVFELEPADFEILL